MLAGIIVSLFTPSVAKEKLDRFYNLTRTSIALGERVEVPCTLPAGIVPPPRRMLTTALGLELPLPSKTSLAGFLAGWLGVAGLIYGFAWIVRW